MTLLEFTQKINVIKEKSALKEAIVSFVNTPPESSNRSEEDKIYQVLENLSKEAFASFGQNLGFCRKYCLEELEKEDPEEDLSYIEKLKAVKNSLDNLTKTYQEIIERKESEKTLPDDPYTLEQQREVLRELVDKTKSLKDEIDKANEEITEANKSLDGKMFSLLTNTVAILGIFVAIAFTGLGTFSLFSNIDLQTSIQSAEAFIKNTFFILLVGTLIYNLLIVLVYFIFKLSRPLKKTSDEDDTEKTFNQTINLSRFFWVDGILVLLTAASFVASLIIK